MNKNKLKSNYLFQIGIILSVLALAAYAMPSSIPAKAFAQDVPDTSQDLVDTNVDQNTDVVVDVDVLMSEADCEEGNDDIDQQTTSESDQDAYVSTNVQTSQNIAVTPDVDLAGCNPTDQTNQGISQTSDQGDEGYQTSVQDARNYAYDNNVSYDLRSLLGQWTNLLSTVRGG